MLVKNIKGDKFSEFNLTTKKTIRIKAPSWNKILNKKSNYNF